MKVSFLTLLALITFSMTYAQINTAFTFGSLGSGSMTVSSFSGPLSFEGVTECMTLKNGVIVMTKDLQKGDFKLGCRIKSDGSSIIVSVYPNPLTGYVTVKSEDFTESYESLNAVLLDARGRLIFEKKIKRKEIYEGLRLDMQHVANGFYLLKIQSNNQVHIFKLIKTGNL